MHPVTDTLSQILHDADVRVAFAKADILDGLLVRLRRVVVEDIGRDARAQLDPAPAFSPEALAAMEALDAATTPAQPKIDPLADAAPAAQPSPTPATDPLDAPRSRGRRRRGETTAAPEAAPAPERDTLPEPDALDLPGEPVGDDVAVAAPETTPEVALPASLDDIFGSPPAEYDPLGD